jgi:hypothetical protein
MTAAFRNAPSQANRLSFMSRDKDLLRPGCYGGIQIVKVADFLNLIRTKGRVR